MKCIISTKFIFGRLEIMKADKIDFMRLLQSIRYFSLVFVILAVGVLKSLNVHAQPISPDTVRLGLLISDKTFQDARRGAELAVKEAK